MSHMISRQLQCVFVCPFAAENKTQGNLIITLDSSVCVRVPVFLAGLRGSLSRLQLDYVDIVFANRSDINAPMEGQITSSSFPPAPMNMTPRGAQVC